MYNWMDKVLLNFYVIKSNEFIKMFVYLSIEFIIDDFGTCGLVTKFMRSDSNEVIMFDRRYVAPRP
jgi:hypothetical protein